MSVLNKIGIVIVTGIVGLSGLALGERLSISGLSSFVSSAEARVGRPLTPVSVAGVGRRTTRRAVRRTYVAPAPVVVVVPAPVVVAPRCVQHVDAYGRVYSRCY